MNNPLQTRVRKIGTSHGIIIPVPILRAYSMQRGDVIQFEIIHKKRLVIYKPNKQ